MVLGLRDKRRVRRQHVLVERQVAEERERTEPGSVRSRLWIKRQQCFYQYGKGRMGNGALIWSGP